MTNSIATITAPVPTAPWVRDTRLNIQPLEYRQQAAVEALSALRPENWEKLYDFERLETLEDSWALSPEEFTTCLASSESCRIEIVTEAVAIMVDAVCSGAPHFDRQTGDEPVGAAEENERLVESCTGRYEHVEKLFLDQARAGDDTSVALFVAISTFISLETELEMYAADAARKSDWREWVRGESPADYYDYLATFHDTEMALRAWLLKWRPALRVPLLPQRSEPCGETPEEPATPKVTEAAPPSTVVEPAPQRTGVHRTGAHQTGVHRIRQLPNDLRFVNDVVHRAVVAGLSRARILANPDREVVHRPEEKSFVGEVTLCNGEVTPSTEDFELFWKVLQESGPVLVKAHLALWARYMEESGDLKQVQYVPSSLAQVCADIGLKKKKSGGYDRAQKERLAQLLATLFHLRIEGTFFPSSGEPEKVSTRAWSLRDRDGNVLATDNAESLISLLSEGFRFAPGSWYGRGALRTNWFGGKVSARLMALHNTNDRWAILLGAYLANQARINQFRSFKLKVGTLLDQAGLAQSQRDRVNISETTDKLIRALDKLKALGVLAEWRDCALKEDDSLIDEDAADAWAAYGQDVQAVDRELRTRCYEFRLPFKADEERLAEAESSAVKRAKSRSRRKPADIATAA